MDIVGATGCIEIDCPFSPVPDAASITIVRGSTRESIAFESANHYTLQADAFSRAILYDLPTPVALENSVANMEVLDAIRRSAETGEWTDVTGRS